MTHIHSLTVPPEGPATLNAPVLALGLGVLPRTPHCQLELHGIERRRADQARLSDAGSDDGDGGCASYSLLHEGGLRRSREVDRQQPVVVEVFPHE